MKNLIKASLLKSFLIWIIVQILKDSLFLSSYQIASSDTETYSLLISSSDKFGFGSQVSHLDAPDVGLITYICELPLPHLYR